MPAVEPLVNRIDISALRPFVEVKKGYTPFASGDVIFAKITPCMENGKTAVVPELPHCIAFGSTEFHVIRPRDGIHPLWIFYFLSSRTYRSEAEHNMTGAVGQRRVRIDFISQSKIPLPPLNEQKRIVAKIEELFSELDAGEESLRRARRQLGVYRQSLLKQAFEGKLTETWRAQNPDKLESPDRLLARITKHKPRMIEDHPSENWCMIQLGELTDYITSGSRGWAAYYSDSGSTFIRAQNLNKDCLDLEDIAFVSLPQKAEGTRTLTKTGDILITITGANVTKAGYIDRDIGEAYVSQHVALCRLKEPTLARFLYLYIITSAGGRRDLEKAAYGAGKPGLNLTNVRELRVPVCSLSEQQEVVSLLDSQFEAIEQNDREIDAALRRSEALRQSILKKAFTGQLVPQDPTDEPASALLARIRDERGANARVQQ